MSVVKLTTALETQLDSRAYWIDEDGDVASDYAYVQKIYTTLGLTVPANVEADMLALYKAMPAEEVLVRVQEESTDPALKTTGHFKAEMWNMLIPGTVGIHTFDFSYPFIVSMLSFEHVGETDQVGDVFSILVAPDTVIGALTADATAGDTTFSASSTFMERAFPGELVSVGGEALGYIVSLDQDAGTFTAQNAISTNMAAASPTYISITVEALLNIEIIETTANTTYGHSKIGGSPVPAGSTMRVVYDNKNGVAKRFCGVVEYLY